MTNGSNNGPSNINPSTTITVNTSGMKRGPQQRTIDALLRGEHVPGYAIVNNEIVRVALTPPVRSFTMSTQIQRPAGSVSQQQVEVASAPTHSRLSLGVERAGAFAEIEIDPRLRVSLPSGCAHTDAMFTGDGIRPSTVAMISGMSGGGKSTWTLQMINALLGQGHVVLLNGGEESPEQVMLRAEQKGFKNLSSPDCKAFFSSFVDIGDILAYADLLREEHCKFDIISEQRGFFLFIDSIQTVGCTRPGAGRQKGDQKQQEEAVYRLNAWTKQHYTVAMFVSQVGKDGEFLGTNGVKHAIDMHLHMRKNTDRKSENYGCRLLDVAKNRWGSAGVEFEYEITRNGINFL